MYNRDGNDAAALLTVALLLVDLEREKKRKIFLIMYVYIFYLRCLRFINTPSRFGIDIHTCKYVLFCNYFCIFCCTSIFVYIFTARADI